jgi:hypothetical protein
MADRIDKLQEMRDLLDFLQEHEEIPLPYFGMVNSFVYDEIDVDTAARIMAPCDKDIGGSYFSLNRKFGSLEFSVNFAREEVCERIVVGTKEIPARTIEARTEEIVEWNCPDGVLRRS